MPSLLIALALSTTMVLGLALIPFGLPGLWVIAAAMAVGALLGEVGATTLSGLLVAAVVAEVAEFVVVEKLTAHYGGGKRAYALALLGGIVGAAMGTPLPIIGTIAGLLLGTFGGAAAGAWWARRDLDASVRVGLGAVLGRAAASALKIGVGLVMVGVGAAAIWVG